MLNVYYIQIWNRKQVWPDILLIYSTHSSFVNCFSPQGLHKYSVALLESLQLTLSILNNALNSVKQRHLWWLCQLCPHQHLHSIPLLLKPLHHYSRMICISIYLPFYVNLFLWTYTNKELSQLLPPLIYIIHSWWSCAISFTQVVNRNCGQAFTKLQLSFYCNYCMSVFWTMIFTAFFFWNQANVKKIQGKILEKKKLTKHLLLKHTHA